jgi:hypothetical protein
MNPTGNTLSFARPDHLSVAVVSAVVIGSVVTDAPRGF